MRLPANATATIDQTSLLGEKYVALARPAEPRGNLADGATITLASTTQAVQIEQVLGALSLLLNGGGIGQLHDIVVELNRAAGGRGPEIRRLLADADRVIATIDSHRAGIIEALRPGRTRWPGHCAPTTPNISIALRDLPAGLKVLAGQRHQLVRMINALGRLGRVADAHRAGQPAQLRRRPARAAPDAEPARAGGLGPAAVAAGAADLPVPRLGAQRHPRRLPEHLRDDEPEHARRPDRPRRSHNCPTLLPQTGGGH